jgi:tRNA(Ile)-lysidine synthase
MAAAAERRACRVLRPLLDMPRARLAATLVARGQGWIEDPSNRDPAFARARLRRARLVLADEGLTAERVAATARRLGRARSALEATIAAMLARAVWLHPAGFAWLDAGGLAGVPDEVGLRAVAAVLSTVSGSEYPPRLDALERLFRALRRGLPCGRTLGGCLVLPRRGRVLVCREPAAMAAAVPAPPGAIVAWDGRFRMRMPETAPRALLLRGVGDASLPDLPPGVPPAVRPTLPAVCDAAGIVAVPHTGYHRDDTARAALAGLSLGFRPRRALTRGDFTVV